MFIAYIIYKWEHYIHTAQCLTEEPNVIYMAKHLHIQFNFSHFECIIYNFATFKITCFEFDIIRLSNLFMFGQWQKYGFKNFLRNSA